jgi:hypothetical protein
VSEDHTEPADPQDPVDKLLDAIFYGPVGALAGLSDDSEALAERGRQHVALQLNNAKFLGQMVVTYGSKEVAKRASDLWASTVGSSGPAGGQASSQKTEPSNGEHEPTKAPLVVVAPIDHLIAGYDDLSASQVVRLLDGLLPDELHELCTYEGATRNRRTILNRAAQLLEGAPEAS